MKCLAVEYIQKGFGQAKTRKASSELRRRLNGIIEGFGGRRAL